MSPISFVLFFLLNSAAQPALNLFGPVTNQHKALVSPKATSGGVIRVGTRNVYDSLNPFSIVGSSPLFLKPAIFEPLAIRSSVDLVEYHGLLAEDLKFEEKSLLITLRKIAKFADGRPVTAHDVVFTIELFRRPEIAPSYRQLVSKIQSVEVVSKHKIRLKFDRLDLWKVHPVLALPVLPKHFYSAKDFSKSYNEKALGSGPYRVSKFELGQSLVLQKNPKYWARSLDLAKGRFNFSEIRFKTYREKNDLG